MELTPSRWHERYAQQARWTRQIRQYLLNEISLVRNSRILEAGCGTGVILQDLQDSGAFKINRKSTQYHGLDIEGDNLKLTSLNVPWAKLTMGDAHFLPFAGGSFDLTYCHFLLLWVSDPVKVLTELTRVTRPEGYVIAMAEPDYGGRIDYPEELHPIGKGQFQALIQQGADPEIGRKLSAIFHLAGLRDVETGVLGGNWKDEPDEGEREMEWQIILYDLKGLVEDSELNKLRHLEESALERGERVLFVPTFYAKGRV